MGGVLLYGTTIGVTKGDTRSLDYSPYSKPGYPHYLPTYYVTKSLSTSRYGGPDVKIIIVGFPPLLKAIVLNPTPVMTEIRWV